MDTEIYGANIKEIAPEKAKEYQTYILAIEKRRSGSDEYPTITYYKLVQVGKRYKFYTYVEDTNVERCAEREDNLPLRYSRDQALALWKELTVYMKEGAEIGRGPVFWEVTLNRNGTINSSIKEDWGTNF